MTASELMIKCEFPGVNPKDFDYIGCIDALEQTYKENELKLMEMTSDEDSDSDDDSDSDSSAGDTT